MKIQDIVFVIAFLFFALRQNPRWSASAGLICLVISIPLFATWTFFTAERLTWYGAAFFLLSIIQYKIGRIHPVK